MQRIVHLTSVHSPFDVRIFHKECCHLVQSGFETKLIAPHSHDEIIEGVEILAVHKPINRFGRFLFTTLQVYRRVIRLNADLYHFHDPDLIPLGLLLRLLGKVVVYDIHEDVPRHIMLKAYLPLWLRRILSPLLELFENLAATRFSALVAATPNIASRFDNRNQRTVVLRNFPLLDELSPNNQPSWSQRDYAVAYVGGLSLERGLLQMIEAMSLLPCELDGKLILAGNFSQVKFEDVSHLPGWQQTEVRGHLNREEVRRLLGEVRCGIVTLLPTPSYISSLPIKMFEYMSAGIPVIASDFPLWREIIQHANCGILVNPENPREIAGAISYLLNHPREAEEMGRQGRSAIEQMYNWEAESQRLFLLYEELINEHLTPVSERELL